MIYEMMNNVHELMNSNVMIHSLSNDIHSLLTYLPCTAQPTPQNNNF